MILATTLLLLLPPAGTVNGTVRAGGTREPIAATVQVAEARRLVRADERGFYVLAGLPAGRHRVRASAPGYEAAEREVQVPDGGAVRLDLELAPRAVRLEGLEARGEPAGRGASAAGPGAVRIDARQIDLAPALAEADVLRTVQLLPSVAAASDFSSALYVRGGTPDQNLVTLDGAPLFNPYHLGGVFGAIDPDAVASVDVLPGGFPAAVGDRLSSAIDIRTRDGGRDRARGFGSVGLVSTRAGVDGPLPGGRGSYLASVRRTYLDLFTRAAYGLGVVNTTLPYAFTDAYLKLTHDVGPAGRLSASVYLDGERLSPPRTRPLPGQEPPDEERDEDGRADWGSRMASLTYRQPLGPTLVGEARLAVSTFGGRFSAWRSTPVPDAQGRPAGSRRETVLDARTGMRDLLAGADLTWYGRRHRVRAGAQLDSYLFRYGISGDPAELGETVSLFDRDERPRTLAAYLEDEWSPREGVALRGGLRVLHAGDRGTAWLPRLGARFAVTPSLSLSVAAGRSAQAIHSLRNEESMLASLVAYDLLATVPRAQGLATAEDLSVGAEWSRGGTTLRVDAYTRWLHDVPTAPVPDDIFRAPVLLPGGLLPAEGRAHGLEVLARHTRGRAELSLAYSLARVELETDGVRYAPRFERRHTLDAMAALPLGRTGLFTSRLSVASGQPYTPAVGVTEPLPWDPEAGGTAGQGGRVLLLGGHNTARLPAYVRLDVGVRRDLQRRWFGRPMTITPYVQVLNVLSSRNVLAGEARVYGSHGPQMEYTPQLTILPTLGVEWRF